MDGIWEEVRDNAWIDGMLNNSPSFRIPTAPPEDRDQDPESSSVATEPETETEPLGREPQQLDDREQPSTAPAAPKSANNTNPYPLDRTAREKRTVSIKLLARRRNRTSANMDDELSAGTPSAATRPPGNTH
ncbi:hypothetical protein PG984_015149 [Apiospora sp. TS-2023a]